MPTDMSKYPAEWPAIRATILLRAGGDKDDPRVGARCEWCNVRNYDVIEKSTRAVFVSCDSHGEATSIKCWFDPTGYGVYSIVVLTIAHIDDPDPMNCDPANLAALCQKCHNTHDAKMRKTNRLLNAAAKSGQLALDL